MSTSEEIRKLRGELDRTESLTGNDRMLALLEIIARSSVESLDLLDSLDSRLIEVESKLEEVDTSIKRH